MTEVEVAGVGAVSPAGWGIERLRAALAEGRAWPTEELPRPGWQRPLRVRAVPPPSPRPAYAAHPRMRRTSPISHYLAGAALEALGACWEERAAARLGIVLCVMAGCVNYSKRFYAETLADPATASPLVFPETVFNAPASHLGALLGTREVNYTLVGDPGTYLQGLALGAHWLRDGMVDGCLVVGAEEKDWLTSEALGLLNRGLVLSEGAGALYLRRVAGDAVVRLDCVSRPQLYAGGRSRAAAARAVRAELPAGAAGELLCDSRQDVGKQDAAESAAWADWSGERLSPKAVLGEGFAAAAAWQCVAAVDWLQRTGGVAARVSVVGCNQQAIGARFIGRAPLQACPGATEATG